MVETPTIKTVHYIHTDGRKRKRELRVVPAIGDDMTPIAGYELPWDNWTGQPLADTIERARVEHGAR
jgi:hypothetical protein